MDSCFLMYFGNSKQLISHVKITDWLEFHVVKKCNIYSVVSLESDIELSVAFPFLFSICTKFQLNRT